MTSDPLERFSALTREWFRGTFAEPTPAQAQGWLAIADRDNTLVIAPTGSRKDAVVVPVGHRPARSVCAKAREGRHARAVRLAAESAGRRRRTQPAHPANGCRPHRRTPRRARTR